MTFLDDPPVWCLVLVSLFASVAIIISLINFFQHVRHYTRPHLQLYIVRIILLVPIYALASLFGVFFQAEALYFDTVRDCYEAFVIYCFLTLMLEYSGGESVCCHVLQNKVFQHPWPMCFLPHITFSLKFLRICKQGCLQFVIIKPIMAFLSIICLITNEYDSTGYTWFRQVVYNISYGIALYVLFLFYVATKSLLQGFSPVFKFAAVKCVVFLTFWQSFVLGFMPDFTNDEISKFNNFILCFEMMFFAVLHSYAFRWQEFRSPIAHIQVNVLDNINSVLSITDVIHDTVHSFKPSYKEYQLTKINATSNAATGGSVSVSATSISSGSLPSATIHSNIASPVTLGNGIGSGGNLKVVKTQARDWIHLEHKQQRQTLLDDEDRLMDLDIEGSISRDDELNDDRLVLPSAQAAAAAAAAAAAQHSNYNSPHQSSSSLSSSSPSSSAGAAIHSPLNIHPPGGASSSHHHHHHHQQQAPQAASADHSLIHRASLSSSSTADDGADTSFVALASAAQSLRSEEYTEPDAL